MDTQTHEPPPPSQNLKPFLLFAWQLKHRGQEGIWEAITVVCFGSLTPTPSPWLCRSNAATLPACSLGNKHILNHSGPVSAKATLVEPHLTSSGQKSWTPSDEFRLYKSSSVYWTQATLVAARQSNPGRTSWVPFVETEPMRTYSSSLVSTQPRPL